VSALIQTEGLGRWHGRRGGRRGWGGAYYGGAYPLYSQPVYEIDPIGPIIESDAQTLPPDAGAKNIDEIVAKKVAEALAKQRPAAMGDDHGWPLRWRRPDMGQMYIDQLGPGARDGDIDREARPDEIVDEAVPAQQALLWRQQAGLVGMGDTSPTTTPRQKSICAVIAVAGLAGGVLLGRSLAKALGL
jgi:hypothetical protein